MTARGEKLTLTDSFNAEADLSASQYRFVKAGAAGGIVACNAQGERSRGVLADDPPADEAGLVVLNGIAVVEVGTTPITDGALVTTAADGRAEPAASGDWARGEALEAQATENALVAIRLLDHLVP